MQAVHIAKAPQIGQFGDGLSNSYAIRGLSSGGIHIKPDIVHLGTGTIGSGKSTLLPMGVIIAIHLIGILIGSLQRLNAGLF